MTNFMFTNFTKLTLDGTIGALTGKDLRVALLMSNNTAAANRDANNLAAFNLDEFNGAGYSQKTLASKVLVRDDVNYLTKMTADPTAFGALSNGTRAITAILIYEYVSGAPAADIPYWFIDDPASFPLNPGGSSVTVNWHSNGVFRLKNP